MAVSVKHKFTSAKADGPDSTQIRPSNWNDAHDIELAGPALLGKPDAGSGPAVEVPAGDGLAFSGSSIRVAAGGITSDMHAAGSVATAAIQDSAVTTGKINDGAVTTPKIYDGSVTTAKIADLAVTAAKLAGIPIISKTGNYTLVAGDRNAIVQFILTAAATLTVPSAATLGAEYSVAVVNVDSSTDDLTLSAASGSFYGGVAGTSFDLAPGESCRITSDGTNWIVTELVRQFPASIGWGQTWQNVTGSRAANTAYQNTTGKPICVSVFVGAIGATRALEVSAGNSTWVEVANTTTGGGTMQAVVPPGHYSRMNGSFGSWRELR